MLSNGNSISFRNNIHSKVTFNDHIRMAWLLKVLDGDTKRSVQSIGTNGIFNTTALKTLKRDSAGKFLILYLKLKNLLDQPQIKDNGKIALRQYYH